MLEAIVNGKTVKVDFQGKEVTVNDKTSLLDILSVQDGKFFHMIYNQHSYMFELIGFDKESKTYRIGFDGRVYEIGVKDRFDQLLKSMGLDQVSKPKVNEVKAPMPGLVLSIKVTENQEVKKGDPILILEAMKMENIIKSPIDGIVKQILVSDKQAVDKNQALITFN
ncbi:MAG: biotin/lipoyl-binding protein [Bacteroidia bacterium]|nr:biotin/lipoyl-binding protein [Bacteroidia bacterium]